MCPKRSSVRAMMSTFANSCREHSFPALFFFDEDVFHCEWSAKIEIAQSINCCKKKSYKHVKILFTFHKALPIRANKYITISDKHVLLPFPALPSFLHLPYFALTALPH